jgi:hypothetical protein
MIAKYYVALRPQINENHAVHKENCPFLPDDKKRIYLGVFNSGGDAIKEGQRHFFKTNCCPFCLKEHQPVRKEQVYSEITGTEYLKDNSQISLSLKGSIFYFLN